MIPTQEGIIDCLKTVYDPEFPLVDIWTMGLIYNIRIQNSQLPDNNSIIENGFDDEGFVSYGDQGQIVIDMTLTTPACPAADYLPEAAKTSVQVMYPEYEVILHLIREPTWTIEMIKDEDLKRMFE